MILNGEIQQYFNDSINIILKVLIKLLKNFE
jgi:hypothetical protein